MKSLDCDDSNFIINLLYKKNFRPRVLGTTTTAENIFFRRVAHCPLKATISWHVSDSWCFVQTAWMIFLCKRDFPFSITFWKAHDCQVLCHLFLPDIFTAIFVRAYWHAPVAKKHIMACCIMREERSSEAEAWGCANSFLHRQCTSKHAKIRNNLGQW